MQKLHLVGFTTDHRGLILSRRRGAKTGGYVLELDDAVTAAVTDGLARRTAAREAGVAAGSGPDGVPVRRPESALTVRELQARLRAGRSVDDVAAEAGVEPEWVARFAPPVEAERQRVVQAARTAHYERPRLGPSGLPLGAAVFRNLAARGVRLPAGELDHRWTARQGADGRWLVTVTYTSRRQRQTATWALDPSTGAVRADDRLAAELAFVAPERGRASTPSPPPAAAAGPTTADREAARRVALARRAAEAQLDEAVREASKRHAELARRAGSGSGSAPEPHGMPLRAR